MFQAFILFCVVGVEQTPESCYVDLSKMLFKEEEVCQANLVEYLTTEVLPQMHSDWEIVNLGCTNYLITDKQKDAI